MLAPQLTETEKQTMMTEVFLGYNHNLELADGEFYDMENLSADAYPLLAPRPRREQRIRIRRQILHVVKLPVRQLEVVVVSEKDLRHHGLLLSLRQLWCQHGLTSVSSCPADQKGSAALSPRGSA